MLRSLSRHTVLVLGGAVALAVLLGATLAVEAWQVRSLTAADVDQAQAETVALVRAELADVIAEMEREAQAAADLPAVREVAASRADGPETGALAALARLPRGSRTSIEVVSDSGAILAWSGATFPRLATPPIDSLQTRIVSDDAGRRALVVWRPLADGAVRVVQVVQAAVPVRNRYLQDYDITDAWRPGAPVPFSVRFGSAGDHALVGPDGTLLGSVEVGEPNLQGLTERRRQLTRAFSAWWATLLLLWVLFGVGDAMMSALHRAERAPTRRYWLRALAALAAFIGGLAALRYGMLALDVPVRWLDGARRPAALFDPALLASDFGGGALRSPGDLVLSAVILLVATGTALVFALRYAASVPGTSRARKLAGTVGAAVVPPALLLLSARWIERSVLDATMPYTDQAGPLLTGPMLAALAGMVGVLAATATGTAAVVSAARSGGGRLGWAAPIVVVLAGALVLGAFGWAPWIPTLALAALGCALAVTLHGRPERQAWPLTFRGVLIGALALAPVLYGVMEEPLRQRTQLLLEDAAFAFSDNRDDRVTAAIDQVFDEARADDALGPVLLDALVLADSARRAEAPLAADSSQSAVEALARGLVQSSLLGSLADVATELRIVSPAGDTLGSYVERDATNDDDGLGYTASRTRFAERDRPPRFLRLSANVAERRGIRRTAAIGPILDDEQETVAWLYLRVTPRTTRFPTETPFPRVLVQTGLFGLDDEALGYAEYDDGVLVRQRGPAPLRLDSTIFAALSGEARAYRRPEVIDGRPTLAYYERQSDDARDVVSVRAPSGDRLDALFVLLRLCLAGLALGAVVFGVGLVVRWRAGLLPVRRTRFRDKVLNRFLIVGLASVALTGAVGQRVIVEQNREAVRDALRQRLSRAAAVFALEPDASESARLDAVSGALGIDVHLYQGERLVASSRRQLVRQRLIEPRLPGMVYRALYLADQPYAFSEDEIGTFGYTTGYLALPDSLGRPAQALAIPTLSEQAGIEAGRSRYVAYLFGGLLALLAAILVIAVVLAGQLTRPFGRLREGLRAVGAGEAEEPIPVETHDEVGELVESFNAMQAALVESRRQLAEQEREMAWSTMARQVAHEIKNPLMPMKLSVQHLQRTFHRPDEHAPPEDVRFAGQFERTTGMLIDQIETLDRIASDFSRFARMPMRAPETFDLSEVAREAAALFEGPLAESGRATLDLDLSPQPLRVLADREELRRVLVNLLTNALQAMPEREEPGRIVLRTQLAGGFAEALVEDDGAGIPAEIQEQVFQPSFSTKTSGMGLGLAISKRAVEAAHGTITFETAEGRGTTFSVRLPPAPAE